MVPKEKMDTSVPWPCSSVDGVNLADVAARITASERGISNAAAAMFTKLY